MTRARHSIWTTACRRKRVATDKQHGRRPDRFQSSFIQSHCCPHVLPHIPATQRDHLFDSGRLCVCVWSGRWSLVKSVSSFNFTSTRRRRRRRNTSLRPTTKHFNSLAPAAGSALPANENKNYFVFVTVGLVYCQSSHGLMRKENLSSVHIIRVHRPCSRTVDRPRPVFTVREYGCQK